MFPEGTVAGRNAENSDQESEIQGVPTPDCLLLSEMAHSLKSDCPIFTARCNGTSSGGQVKDYSIHITI